MLRKLKKIVIALCSDRPGPKCPHCGGVRCIGVCGLDGYGSASRRKAPDERQADKAADKVNP
ncbi:MAG: hypothetical protein LBQ63_02910 [Deltaproteobacteria bacterium]|jgi:hypothetical protein|nr:hypothetical protein [Deltaproteobacteria bacterium]